MTSNLIIISFVVMLVLLFLKVPVFAAVMSGAVVYFIVDGSVSAITIGQRIISGCEGTTLMAIPFFVCAGIFMNYTGVTKRIMDFCEVLTGRMRGGLAQVNVLLSTLMGGLSGSNLADAAMEAKMLVPTMVERGFSLEFSTVVTACSAMITPLIPPGICMIIYASLANLSVGKLFVAGIGPGLLLCIAYMGMVSVISKKRGYEPIRTERLKMSEAIVVLRRAFFPLCLPVIIIGGIRLGIFTPVEAGAVSIIYALILGFAYRTIDLKTIYHGLKEAAISTSSIMLIVAAASTYSWVLTKEQIPQMLCDFIIGTISNKYIFLLLVNILLLVVGMFIEGNASMLILVPLLHPIAVAYGINEIQFAMMFIFNSAIGDVTPPFGTLMFVTCGITKCKMQSFVKEAIPFYALLLVCLALLTFFPFFSTALVNLIY